MKQMSLESKSDGTMELNDNTLSPRFGRNMARRSGRWVLAVMLTFAATALPAPWVHGGIMRDTPTPPPGSTSTSGNSGPGAAVEQLASVDPAWASSIWSDALNKDEPAVFQLLHTMATRHETAASEPGGGSSAVGATTGADHSDLFLGSTVADSVDAFLSHLQEQAASRLKSYNESMKKLAGHVADSDWRDALVDALGADEASLDTNEILALEPHTGLRFKDDVIKDPQIVSLISSAVGAAQMAEDSNDLLTAQDLYYRLNQLQDRQYEPQLDRLFKRLGLLRFYDPGRLDELMNDHLKKIGEKPRPVYAADDATWEKKLQGIERKMVIDALNIAAANHYSQIGYGPLIAGGLDSLETLATTSDLKAVFPGLADQAARDKFVSYLKTEIDYWKEQKNVAGSRVNHAIDRLEETNRDTVKLPSQVLYHEFGEGIVSQLDQFSQIIWPYEMDLFRRQLDGTYTGVGIQIVLDENNQLKVVTPLEGSPALRAGIRADDSIVAIDGRSTMGITINQAIDQITGPRGQYVTLSVQRKDADHPIDIRIRREEIAIESVKGWTHDPIRGWDYMIDPASGIAYIRLTGFLRQTVTDFDSAISQIGDHLNGLVIDLRFNPGGQLQAVIQLCNRFLDEGVIVSTEGPGHVQTEVNRAVPYRANRLLKGVPVVVLINQGSASASEIMSGCLRDHERAIVIGTRSYGKGSVQKISDGIDGGKAWFRITVEHYLLPSGAMIHRERNSTKWGVDPHLEVRMSPDETADALKIMQGVDVVPDPDHPWTAQQIKERNPDRLLNEPLDLQLQAALVMLRSKIAGSETKQAMIKPGEN